VYSRGIRQGVYQLSKDNDWRGKHNMWIGGYEDTPGDYSDMLARSIFCLVMPGGWPPGPAAAAAAAVAAAAAAGTPTSLGARAARAAGQVAVRWSCA
jgi:hypothetical protein